MTDKSTCPDTTPISFTEIGALNRMLQAVRLLRQSEQACAVMSASAIDPDGKKLNAYTLGLFDGVRMIAGADIGILKLLAYLHTLSEDGPGSAAQAAEEICDLDRQEDLQRFIERGRQTVFEVYSGEESQPGQFARLLLSGSAFGITH